LANETHNYLDKVDELQQIFMAKALVLRKFPKHVSNVKSLKLRAASSLAERAIGAAYRHYSHERYRESRQFLMLALKYRPGSLWNTRVHRLAAKLLLGKRGTEAVIEMKRLLVSIHGEQA
jgi:hypothetical protein